MPAHPATPGASLEPEDPAAHARARRLAGLALFVLGLLLLAAAVLVAGRRGQIGSAFHSLESAGWPVIGALVLLPMANWLLTAAMFTVLNRQYGRVGWGDMTALIGSAWLLNLLPLRPGMVGRIAYHKMFHGIRVRDSARVLAATIGCTAAAATGLAVIALAAELWRPAILWPLSTSAFAAVVIVTVVLERRNRAGIAWRLGAATAIRAIDVLIWTLRYWLVFDAIGQPKSPAGAAIIAAASQAAMAVPVQLGVREWIVAFTASLVGGTGGRTDLLASAADALPADLVNRACELAVVLPVGLACTLWLWVHRPGIRMAGTGRHGGSGSV